MAFGYSGVTKIRFLNISKIIEMNLTISYFERKQPQLIYSARFKKNTCPS